ncbi:CU044_2847 family protein [Mucilaginibacter polytrichastri]|uniref:CU044_2847 family protein n=1 Tax=Mucilaginibacter polytrichastri TaxID=1302689 RepID=UPI0008E8C8FB|nr:CU044_2847 family protein [Mucilaginibacter polytrichastri]SFS82843.1 hypothetical protein SAMN04487890_104296 [Mucilaginibacter polytrichastri]
MESNIIKVRLDDNTECLFEVTATSGRESVSALDEIFDFQQVKQQIQLLSSSLLEMLKSVSPTKASLEFGIELSVESGKLTSLIVKGSGKGNIKITLEWEKEPNV